MLSLDPFIEASELRDLIRTGEMRPREVAEFFLARIERLNPDLGAYMIVTAERALAEADRIEAERRNARDLPLYGVPYSLKDLTPIREIPNTLGSKNFADSIPPEDAIIAARLREAGGVLLGKNRDSRVRWKAYD